MLHESFIEKYKFVSVNKFDYLLEDKTDFSMALYKSPQANMQEFLNKLETLLCSIPINSWAIISCGDFNIHFSKNLDNDTKSLCNLLNYVNLNLHVDHPTTFISLSS